MLEVGRPTLIENARKDCSSGKSFPLPTISRRFNSLKKRDLNAGETILGSWNQGFEGMGLPKF